MIIGPGRFNIILLLAILACGISCRAPKDDAAREEKAKDKLLATFRLHLEEKRDAFDLSMPVQVYRAKPVTVMVNKSPFLTESEVSEARIVEEDGGFVLAISFKREGAWLLEQYTSSNPGRHFAVFSQFGPDGSQSRWLAAPTVPRRIGNGVFIFAADASREEAELIVRGLNNLARNSRKNFIW